VADLKIIKKVPSERFLVAWKFWKNYVVFADYFGQLGGITVFNIEDGHTIQCRNEWDRDIFQTQMLLSDTSRGKFLLQVWK
jgi:hypothetical protein